MLAPETDRRHAPDPNDPIWAESWYFNALDLAHDLAIFMRIGLQGNAGTATSSVLVTLGGREVFSRLHYNQPLPAGEVETGISLAGFTFRALELGRRFVLSFAAPEEELGFELVWTANMPLIDSVPKVVAELSSVHAEQFGTVTGEFEYRGRKLRIDGWGNRDHATGPRKWTRFHHHELAWPMFEDGTNLGFLRVFMRAGELADLSWVWDGERFERMKTERFEIELNEEHKARRVAIAARDGLGRLWEVEGRRRGVAHWPWGGYLLNEGFFEFTLADGRRGCGLLELGYLLAPER